MARIPRSRSGYYRSIARFLACLVTFSLALLLSISQPTPGIPGEGAAVDAHPSETLHGVATEAIAGQPSDSFHISASPLGEARGNPSLAGADLPRAMGRSVPSNSVVETVPWIGNGSVSPATCCPNFYGAQAAVYNPANNEIYFGNANGSADIGVLNASTGAPIQAIPVPGAWVPSTLVLDTATDSLYVGGRFSGNVTVIDCRNNTVRVAAIPIAGGPTALAFDLANSTLYVGTNLATITMINTTTNRVEGNISISTNNGESILGEAYDTQNGLLFASIQGYYSQNRVVILNTSSNQLLPRSISTGPTPETLLFNPVSDSVYVAYQWSNHISIVNASTQRIVSNQSVGMGPQGMTLDPVNQVVYVADALESNISTIGASNDTAFGMPIAVGQGPSTTLYDPVTSSVYVFSRWDANVSVVDASTHRTKFSIPLEPQFGAQAILAPRGVVLVADAAGSSVVVFDLSSGRFLPVLLSVGLHPSAIAYDRSLRRAFVANPGSDSISVIDASNLSVRQTIPLGGSPGALAISVDGRELLVTECAAGTVVILSAVNGSILRPGIKVGSCPDAVAVDPVSGRAYVANRDSNNVTVIEPRTGKVVLPGISVGIGPNGIAYDPENRAFYLSQAGQASVALLSLSDNSTFQIAIPPPDNGYYPDSGNVTFDPANHLLYVADQAGLTLIDNRTVLGNVYGSPFVQTGPNNFPSASPQTVVTDPTTGRVYASTWAGTIDVVLGAPEFLPPMFSPAAPEVGQPLQVDTTPLGNDTSLRYSYSGLPPGCAPVNTSDLLCVPSAAGRYTINVTGSDPTGAYLQQSGPITILPSLFGANLSVSPAVIEVGATSMLRATVRGEVGPFVYAYFGLPNGCASANSSLLACTPTSSGSFPIFVIVTDSAGAETIASSLLVVASPPAVLAFLAEPSTVTLGSPVKFVTVTAGGVNPFAYHYDGLPPGCQPSLGPVLVCVPTANGSYRVAVQVTDLLGASGYSNTGVTVTGSPPISLSVVAFYASPEVVTRGNNTLLIAVVTGGSAPFAFAYSGLPLGCPSRSIASLVCTPTNVGRFNITVEITDARGARATATTSLQVSPGPPPSNGPSSATNTTRFPSTAVFWELAAVGAGVGAALAGVIVTVLPRFRRPNSARPGSDRK